MENDIFRYIIKLFSKILKLPVGELILNSIDKDEPELV